MDVKKINSFIIFLIVMITSIALAEAVILRKFDLIISGKILIIIIAEAIVVGKFFAFLFAENKVGEALKNSLKPRAGCLILLIMVCNFIIFMFVDKKVSRVLITFMNELLAKFLKN